jgi:putative transposase
MIEAANKQLKYRFLYHQKIEDFSQLGEYVNKAILNYNNRPHAVLNGKTPMEVINGKPHDEEAKNKLLVLSRQTRIIENQKIKCFGGNFYSSRCSF